LNGSFTKEGEEINKKQRADQEGRNERKNRQERKGRSAIGASKKRETHLWPTQESLGDPVKFETKLIIAGTS
jgi:hypothetical protein